MNKILRFFRIKAVQVLLGFIVLGGLVWYVPKKLGESSPQPAIWHWVLDTTLLTQIEYRIPEGEIWQLLRQTPKDPWTLSNGKFSFFPPVAEVQTMLNALAQWQPSGFSPAKKADWPKYGLTDAAASFVFTFNNGKTQTLKMGRVMMPDSSFQAYSLPEGQSDVLLGRPNLGWFSNPVELLQQQPLASAINTCSVLQYQVGDSLYNWQKRPPNEDSDTPLNTISPAVFHRLTSRLANAKLGLLLPYSEKPEQEPHCSLRWSSADKVQKFIHCWYFPEDSTRFVVQSSQAPDFFFLAPFAKIDTLLLR